MGFGGVDSLLQYYEFNFASDDAQSTFSSQATTKNWPLFKLGGKRPLKNIEGIKILEAEIPFTWYLFNGTDVLLYTDFGTNTNTQMVIPAGNYSAQEVATYLTANYPVSITYNPNTLKFRMELVNNNTFAVSTTSERLAYLLGLKANTVYNSTPGAPPVDYLIFPFVAQMTGSNFLFLCSDTLGNLVDMYLPKSAHTSTGNSGAELAKIPINVGPGNVIFWHDPDPDKYFDMENTNNLTEIDFYLRTNIPGLDGVLNLNGAAFSIKMGVIENDMTQAVSYNGLAKNDRIVKRVRAL